MKTQFKILVGLLFLLSLILTRGGLRASGESSMPVNKVPGSVESKARRLMNNLKKQGFQVERGYFKLYTNADCPTSFKEIGTCWGNNPAAPYVHFQYPPGRRSTSTLRQTQPMGSISMGILLLTGLTRVRRLSSWALCLHQRIILACRLTISRARAISIRTAIHTCI